MTNFEMVKEFHEKFDIRAHKEPIIPANKKEVNLRLKLIHEEYLELIEAVIDEDAVAAADALTDLLYVIYGTGDCFGMDLDACFKEVHRSNMSKLGEDGKPIRNEHGKVMKGPNYSPPDLKSVLY